MRTVAAVGRFEILLDDGHQVAILDSRDRVWRRPEDFKRACSSVELSFLQAGLRGLIERQEAERSGAPLEAFRDHMATLNACVLLNVDVPDRIRRYVEVL